MAGILLPDMGVCHTWYEVPFGQGNVRMVDVRGNPVNSVVSADIPAPSSRLHLRRLRHPRTPSAPLAAT